jgi:hypothetical protein
MKVPKNLFAVVSAVIILLACAIALWIVLQPKPISTYDDCAKSKGSVIFDIYPAICMTKDKQQFTNPHDKPQQNQVGLLHITQWHITLPLAATIESAYYTYDKNDDEIYISTAQLDELRGHISGCTSGLHGLSFMKGAATLPLIEQRKIEPACAVPATEETAHIGEIQTSIRNAVHLATLD